MLIIIINRINVGWKCNCKLFLFIFFLSVINVYSQALSLDSIISAIEKNNPELQQYDYTIQAYDAYAKGARS